MNNILFPTDFSPQSLEAFTFALEYAKVMHHKIIVFHVFSEDVEVSPEVQAIYNELNIENYKDQKHPFYPFENQIDKEVYKDVQVKYKVKKGDFIPTLQQYVESQEDKINLVIMGTNNRTRFFDIFVDTNTIKALESINKPLIAIPKTINFDGKLDNILFLVDYYEDEKAPLKEIVTRGNEFDAKVHIIHFDHSFSESITHRMKHFKQSLALQDFHNCIFKSIETINFKSSLKKYCKENNIDMVCLMNHKQNFYQRLFSQSIAEELVLDLNMPIMAIYGD